MISVLQNFISVIFKLIVIGFCVIVAFIAGIFVLFVIGVNVLPSPDERRAAENAESFRLKTVEWTAFCGEYNCTRILDGFTVGAIGTQFYTLPIFNADMPQDKCRVVISDAKYYEREHGVIKRAINPSPRGFNFFLKCEEQEYYYNVRWDNGVILDSLRGSFLVEQYYGGDPTFRQIWNTADETLDEMPSYASFSAHFRPLTPDFMEFKLGNETGGSGEIYLSTQRLFQGRYVALICSFSCELQTISFAEDQYLTTPHFYQSIAIYTKNAVYTQNKVGWCKQSCETWPAQLDSIARLAKFLSIELDGARNRYNTTIPQ